MQTYIAYKYSNIKDKSLLKDTLLEISKVIDSFGHDTFILGRDAQNWDNRNHPIHSKLAKIISEIKKSDCVFIYIDNNALSMGLFIEIHAAKLFGKRIVVATKKGVKAPYFHLLANESISFDTFDDLREKLKLCQ